MNKNEIENKMLLSEQEFHNAVINHQEPVCPKCRKGRIICPSGKIKKPHFFVCTNECGWIMNIDYMNLIVE